MRAVTVKYHPIYAIVLSVSFTLVAGCGVKEANGDKSGKDGSGGDVDLMEGAEAYQGEYPEPGAVTYTDADGESITVPAIPGHVLLYVSDRVDRAAAESMLKALGAEVKASIPKVGYYLAGVAPGKEGELISALRKDLRVLTASPDFVLAAQSREVLYDIASCEDDEHSTLVLEVLNKYGTPLNGKCEELPGGIGGSSTATGNNAVIALMNIIKNNGGSAYINISFGLEITQLESLYNKALNIRPELSTYNSILHDFWKILFTGLSNARPLYLASNKWDTVMAVAAGNSTYDVLRAVSLVSNDKYAGPALNAYGMIVGATKYLDSNKAPKQFNFVLAPNEEPKEYKGYHGTSFAAPYALAMASQVADKFHVPGTQAVCALKRAAQRNNQVLTGTDLKEIDPKDLEPNDNPNKATHNCIPAQKISVGGLSHACAVLMDGTVWCWGDNESAQLGDGTNESSDKPVRVLGITNAVDVDCGFGHTCAVLATGAVRCWGVSGLGNGDIYSEIPVLAKGITDAVAVNAGSGDACALLKDGTLSCWGESDLAHNTGGTYTSEPVPLKGLKNVVDLDIGTLHSCAVLADGTIKCWGGNPYGELGDGSNKDSYNNPNPENRIVSVLGISSAIDVAVGYLHTCAVLGDGTVWCWGSNQNGELGHRNLSILDSIYQHTLPEPVAGITNAIAITAGGSSTCALIKGGTVECWGGSYGLPKPVSGIADAIAIDSGDSGPCVITASNAIRCWRADSSPVTVTGFEGAESAATPSSEPFDNAVEVAAGTDHGLVLKTDGTLWVSGKNDKGQLGVSDTADRDTWVQSLTEVVGIASGSYHSLARKNDGTLWVTGYNKYGELGIGDSDNRNAWVQSLSAVTAAAGGLHHSIAVATDGTLWTTGYNMYGQLGTGDTADRNAWVQSLSKVTAAAGGTYHSLVRKNDGTLWVTGHNAYGELGVGDAADRDTWTQSLSDVAVVASGSYHSLAIKTDGTLWVTGHNVSGQLGTGDTVDRDTWSQSLSDLTAVAGGADHSLALKNDGTLWATGRNDNGQLGNGSVGNINRWEQVLSDVTAMTAGDRYSLAVKNDGTLWTTVVGNMWEQVSQ